MLPKRAVTGVGRVIHLTSNIGEPGQDVIPAGVEESRQVQSEIYDDTCTDSVSVMKGAQLVKVSNKSVIAFRPYTD